MTAQDKRIKAAAKSLRSVFENVLDKEFHHGLDQELRASILRRIETVLKNRMKVKP